MDNTKQTLAFQVSKKSDEKEERSTNMTLRINKELLAAYDTWANKTNRSRNSLMCMALQFAMEHIELIDEE